MLVCDNLEVRFTESRGRGVFASKFIPKGTVVGDYVGKIYDIDSELPEYPGLYDMWVYKNLTICPDITTDGAHIINHACEYNCGMYPYDGHILIVTLRDIKPGEELTYHYWCSEDSESTQCLCGSAKCRGSWIVTDEECDRYCNWVESVNARFYEESDRVGTSLESLKSYPSRLVDQKFIEMFAI